MLVLLGPVSSASPNGPGPVWSCLLILVAGWVGLSAWRHYLKQRLHAEAHLPTLLGITGICVIMIAAGVWGLLRSL